MTSILGTLSQVLLHDIRGEPEPASKLWQPRSCRFMLLRTLKALPQPEWGHLKGFSPVCEWLWMRNELGREKALLQVWQM